MTAHAALLRGVNVGGHRKVPAAALRSIGDAAGFDAAGTLLTSGNLVLGHPRPGTAAAACAGREDVARLVRDGLRTELGLEVDVVVVTGGDLDAVIAANPFPEQSAADPSKVLLTFYPVAPDPDRVAALDLTGFPEQMVWAQTGGAGGAGGAAFTYYPAGAGTSRLTPAYLRRALGVDGTARNWRTVLALRELVADRDDTGHDDTGRAPGQPIG